MTFQNRTEAGKQLAKALISYKGNPNTLVLALPRGGVPVAFEIAQELHLPLDLMLVRKLGVPGHEELAMGAIANGNVQVLNEEIIRSLGISSQTLNHVVENEHRELMRRNQAYRHGKPPPIMEAKTVILVDDGMATGANMRAAVQAADKLFAAHIVAAVPVASDSAYALLKNEVDEIVCLAMPEPFYGVGAYYRDFTQTTDKEVKELLRRATEHERT
jgi:putative phosphoribosyl transferase